MQLETMNDAECNLLKVLLTEQSMQQFIFQNCQAEFFTNILNRKIFKAAKELYEDGKQVDNVGVYHILRTQDINEKLAEIMIDTIAYSFRVKSYCKQLFEDYITNRIKSAQDAKDLAEIEYLKERYSFEDGTIKSIGDNIQKFKETYAQRQETMVLTGWNSLDNCIGSFCGGDYIALGGSTGTGKTSIALNIAMNLCIQGKKVLYCSLEMPLEQLQNRFNCMITGLNAMKYRSCGFSEIELKAYEKGLDTLKQWDLNVVCDYDLTVEKLRIYAQEQQKKGLDFIVIDYLGLMSGYGNKSLYEKATMISRKLKILATELNVPLLVLVQLNRDIKNRRDKRPVLSDIRESGAIEQDADYVLFAYRDYVYSQDPYKENDLEIIIAKNRHGISNTICKFDFDLKSQRIKTKWGSNGL